MTDSPAYPSLCHDRLREGHARLPVEGFGNAQWRLDDVIGDAAYEREGSDLQARGRCLDEPPWRAHAFSLTKRDDPKSQGL